MNLSCINVLNENPFLKAAKQLENAFGFLTLDESTNGELHHPRVLLQNVDLGVRERDEVTEKRHENDAAADCK